MFFASIELRERTFMSKRTVIILAILNFLLVGCASSQPDDAFVKAALQEREEAYARLAKAIMHFCSVSTDTLDSRQACILERRLSLPQFEQPQLVFTNPAPPRSPTQ